MKEKSKLNNNKKLVLLDAHAIIHRAYHALPDFATSKGEPTGALYGLVSIVLKIASDFRPDFIIACYDLPRPTYRHEVYEHYKANRSKTDDDLALQLESSKKVCEALNIPIYSKEGFEADDILGTIVEKMRGKDVDIVIASGDMDTMQLIDDDYVKVFTLKKGIKDTVIYDEKAVEERFGFAPLLLPDFKGLRGDPSDNIVGVPGIGEKTASELIKNFGSLEEIFKAIDNKGERAQKLIKPRVAELLKENKDEAMFSKMLATIRRDAPIDFSLPEKRWSEGLDIEKAKNLFADLEFRTMGERLKTVVFSSNGESGDKKEDNNQEINIDNKELEETKVALWVADSNMTNPSLEDILSFAKTSSFEKAKEIVFSELEKRNSLSVFENIEKPIIPIIKKMEDRGVLIDKKHLLGLDKKYSEEIKEIEKKIWKEAGEEFNVSSPKQLGKILFEKLGLSVKNQKKTGTGAKSTRESELEKMKGTHPIIEMILEYRELSKLVSTYIEPISKMLDTKGRLHAKFLQTGSTTGRMASQNPNLQNIPISSERGKIIRNAFVAPDGFMFSAFDYSQIELRIAAILSGDSKLIEIFKNKEDVHASVASRVFGVPVTEVTKEMRREAKVINFGILYGMGVNALQQNLGSDRKTAQEFYNTYFKEFSGLAVYLEKMKEEAARDGYTKTLFGRRRYFEGIKSKIPYIKASAERMAINAPIQGTQADIIKIAMKKIDDFIIKNGFNNEVFLILQIHDELVYEIKESLVKEVVPKIIEIMESVLPKESSKGVPILANASVGKNWGEMKPM